MYSPRINEDLIAKIYKIAKAKGIPMTTLVNQILKKELDKMDKNHKSKTKESR